MELGPFCDAIGIDEEVILGQKQVSCDVKKLTNGVVWEIQKYKCAKKYTTKDLVDWVIKIFSLQCENSDALQAEFENNIKSLKDLRNVLTKSPKHYKNEVERLMDWPFNLPAALGLEPVPKFEPNTRANLGPKLLKVLKEKANDEMSMDMSGQSDDDDDDESRRRKAREELVQLKKDLGSLRKVVTSLNDRLTSLHIKCQAFNDLSRTSVSERRRIENDMTKLEAEWKNIVGDWHNCIERLNHVNNNKGNYLDVRYMVRRNKTKQGVFDELNFEFEKTVEDFKNLITFTLDQERKKKKNAAREARQKSKNGQKRPREESNDRDDNKIICLADASDNPVSSKLSLDEFLKSENVEDFKGGKYANSLKAIYLHLSSSIPCSNPSEFIFKVLTQLEALNTDKISSQSFAGNILMEAQILATLHACSDIIAKSKVTICNDSNVKFTFQNNSYTVLFPDGTQFVLGVRDISDGSADTSFSVVKDIFNGITSLKDNNENLQTLVNAVQAFFVERQVLSKKIIEIVFLYKQQLQPKYNQCSGILTESLKAKFITLNHFFTGLYFLHGLAILSDVTILAWEMMALDISAPESGSDSSAASIHSSTLKKIYDFSELVYPSSDDSTKKDFNIFLKEVKKLECIPVAPYKDNMFNVVFHNSAALWFFYEVGYLSEFLGQTKLKAKTEHEEKIESETEGVAEQKEPNGITCENGGESSNENKGEAEEEKAEEKEEVVVVVQEEEENKMEVNVESSVNTKLSSIAEKNCVCVARALGLIGKLIVVPLWTVLEEIDATDKGLAPAAVRDRYSILLEKITRWAKDASCFMTGQERLYDDVPVSLDAVYISLIRSNETYDALTKEILELMFTAFIYYMKSFVFGVAEKDQHDDNKTLANTVFSLGSFKYSLTAFDRVTKSIHLASSYALDALTVFSKARNGQWLDRLGSRNSVKILDMIKNNASKLLKSIYERKIILDDLRKSIKAESDAKSSRCQKIEKKYKLIDNLVKCGGLWKSEKEIDDHLANMNENERLNALKAQIEFRRHVLNEVHEEGLLDLASEGQCFNATSLCENLKAVLKKEFHDTESDIFEFASASDDEYCITELNKACQNAEEKADAEKTNFFTKENFQWILGKLLDHTLHTDMGTDNLSGVCIARKKSQGVYSYYIRYMGRDKIFKFSENKIAKDYQSNNLRVVDPYTKDLVGSRVSRAFYKNDGELEWHDCTVIDVLNNDSDNPLFAVEYEMYGADVETSESNSDLPELQTLTFSCHLLEDYKSDRLRLL